MVKHRHNLTKDRQPYYIGLNLNDNAIGWAVTAKDYTLLRRSGKDMWGTRLFEPGETSEDSRMKRSARRNNQRRKQRIKYLKEFFAEAINEKDPLFFQRLEESYMHIEDRSDSNKQKNSLFCDPDFTDKKYHDAYPTIYHLKKELILNKEPHDVRLIYLALSHYFNMRGHFYNNSLGLDNNRIEISESYHALVEEAKKYDIVLDDSINADELFEILCRTGVSRTSIEKEVRAFFNITTRKKTGDKELIKLMCGLSVRLNSIFPDIEDEELAKTSIGFTKDNYEEILDKISTEISPESVILFELCRDIYNSSQLHNLLGNEKYYSFAMVKSYDVHNADKELLKKVLHRYGQQFYNEMFNSPLPDNYSGYVGRYTVDGDPVRRFDRKGKDKENFYRFVTKMLTEKLPETAQENDPDVMLILERIRLGEFMPKQRSRDNAMIPNQLHASEVLQILNNAANYLPFLNDFDPKYNMTTKGKILDLMTFTRPVHFGPIKANNESRFAWVEYVEGKSGPVLPWNMEELIDMDKARQAFIERLIGKCTYYPDKKVLPRHSLLYEHFVVLNELNTLRINNERPSVQVKQDLYTNLFKTGKKVTQKKIEKELIKMGVIESNGEDTVDFRQGAEISHLSTFGALSNIFGTEFVENNVEMFEDIIFLITVYGTSKQLLKNILQEKYGNELTDKQIDQLASLNLLGWGNLSEAFFNTRGTINEKHGDPDAWGDPTLIDAMWAHNLNAHELLSEKYTYRETIEAYNYQNNKMPSLEDWKIEMVNEQYLHATLKRVLWQTRNIICDIVDTMGYYPSHIFIARGKGNGLVKSKNTRKAELLALYRKVKDPNRDWVKEIEDRPESDFRAHKVYLYYLQMGKCLYTGADISLDELNTSTFDREHIFPQSLTNDNSLEDNLILVNKTINRKKSNKYPVSPAIQSSQMELWKMLRAKGFMSKEKFNRLTRTSPLTPDELSNFVSREMVDQRVGSRTMERMLAAACKNKGARIIFSKSRLIDEFRHQFDFVDPDTLNFTIFARDAYIGIIAGNTYDAAFTSNPAVFMLKDGESPRYNLAKIYNVDRKRGNDIIWTAQRENEVGTIKNVNKMLDKATPLLTKMPSYPDAGLFDETVYNKQEAGKNPDKYIGTKTKNTPRADVTKYGGRTAVTTNCYAVVSYETKRRGVEDRETLITLESVKTMWNIKSKDDPALAKMIMENLLRERRGDVKNLTILHYPVRMNTKIRVDGFDYFIGGTSGVYYYVKPAIQMNLPNVFKQDIKKIEKANRNKAYDEIDINGEFVVNEIKNLALYDKFIAKLTDTIFAKRKTKLANDLIEHRNDFIELKVSDQCKVLEALLNLISGNLSMVNLSLIGLTPHYGAYKNSKILSDYDQVELIFDSVTGLKERIVKLV